jgi:hypothetical protein
VVDKKVAPKKISNLSFWFCYYKKHMSAAGKECSIGMDIGASVRCAIAHAADPPRSIFKDINDKDDETVGCTIACATDPLRSYAKDISDKDDESFVETSNPVGLKSNGSEEGLVLVGDAKQKKHSSTTLSETSNNLLCLSDQLKFWTSKYTVRDANQLIDVSSAACGPSSTILIGATQQNFRYTGTV